jgi:ankyrin repeat protein
MSDHVALVDMLLERGARPNDGESIYHAAQYNRQACLERLSARGADFSSRQQPYGNTPLFFLVGHVDDEGGRAAWFQGFSWLLEHGADPNVASCQSEETPLHGVAAGAPKLATARLLVAHGADVNRPRADGRTPLELAIRHGNTELADLLRAHGAMASNLRPIDAFLGACLTADAESARRALAAQPDLVESMSDDDRAALLDAVRHDRPEAIRLMIALGFELTWEGHGGGTALHHAAWLGKVDMVRELLALGAPVNLRDKQYGSSPLGWASHGSEMRKLDAQYCAIVDLLADAGADRNTTINKWGQPMKGSRVVHAHLRARGFVD